MADLQGFFNEYLPNKLQGNPELAKSINAVFQFDLEGFGTWTVDLTKDSGAVTEGPHAAPGCVLTAKSEDFGQLLDNPAAGVMLFGMGKLKVTNIGLALSLQKLLS